MIDQTEEAINKIKAIKRESIAPLMKHLAYRPAFNIDYYREALLYRFVDLCEAAILLTRSRNSVSAIVCARSAQETFAVIAYLSFRLETLSTEKDLRSLLETMHRLSIGWKGDEEFPEMINVLTCIDKVSKKLDPQFRKQYDMLSESAHPNYQGVLGTYSQPNHETLEVAIGLSSKAEDRHQVLVTTTIQICALLFEHVQSEFEDLMNQALDICIDLHEKGELSDIFYSQKT